MAKSSTRAAGKSAPSGSATIHDQKLLRGEGGELHQIAEGDTPVLTTAQGGPVSDDQNYAQDRRARADADRGLPFPREDLPLRPRAHSRARGACARLRRARLLRDLQVACRHTPAPTSSSAPARRRRPSCASRPSPAARARSTSRATCAASPSSSTPRKATGTSSATTSRSSSSRTRSSFPTSSIR